MIDGYYDSIYTAYIINFGRTIKTYGSIRFLGDAAIVNPPTLNLKRCFIPVHVNVSSMDIPRF